MSRTIRTLRGAAATAIAASVLAVPTAATAEGTPTGADVRLAFPAGDIHLDRGVEDSAALRAASDVVGLRLAWPREGLKVEVVMANTPTVTAGDDTYYDTTVFLADRSKSDTGYISLSWDGSSATVYSYDRDFNSRDASACGATGTVTGKTLVFNVPTACLGGAKTLWASADAGWSTYTDDGDYLQAGDIALHDAYELAVVHEVGTSPAAEDSRGFGGSSDGDPTKDRDGSAGRVEWVDPAGDSRAPSGIDITRVVMASHAAGSTDIVVTTNKAVTDEDVDAYLYGDDARYVTVNSRLDFEGKRETTASYRLAGEWGSRACSGSLVPSGTTTKLVIGADCGGFGPLTWGEVSTGTYGDLGFYGDAVFGDLSLTRVTPSKPATKGRDVSDTCDGRAAKTSFEDTSGNVHAKMIDCLSSYDITQGKGGGEYGAKDPLSRGQVATFLKKTLEAAGKSLPAGNGSCAGKVHGDSLDAMVAAGIMKADSCDLTSKMSRTDMAQATANALTWAGRSPSGAPDYFNDDIWMADAVQVSHDQIAHAGIVTGKSAGAFGPEDMLRRDQMATFLARLLDALKA